MHRDCTQEKKKKVRLLQDGNVFTVTTNKASAFVFFSPFQMLSEKPRPAGMAAGPTWSLTSAASPWRRGRRGASLSAACVRPLWAGWALLSSGLQS